MKAETFVARMMPTWVDVNRNNSFTIERGIASKAIIYSFRRCNRKFRVWTRVGIYPEQFSICLEREVIAKIICWDEEREVWSWGWVDPPDGSELLELELILP